MEVGARQIMDTILQRYALGDIEDITLIKAGLENKNYKVHTQNNTYVVRLYSLKHSIRGSRLRQEIEREHEFIARAIDLSIPTPCIVKNSQDKLITRVQIDNIERFIAVFPFLTGTHLNAFSTKASREVGQIVNKLFEVGLSFQNNDLEMTNDIMSRAFQSYDHLLEKNVTLPYSIQHLFKLIQSQKPTMLSKKLSKGLIHGDLTLENMLFDDHENLIAILDFDDYRYSYLSEEVVMALMHNLHSSEENILRSGNYAPFFEELTQATLQAELLYLNYFLRVRFIHDVANYLIAGYRDLVADLLQDPQIQKYILNTK